MSTTDLLFFIVFAAWLSDMNFDEMNLIKWVGFSAAILWLILFIVKLLVPERKR
ncbi:hypothetical protein [Bacillus badius]|uniref:hypothetical protein n=1 Tax=Bacillus badius TaxID=1455 RepID=UPI0012E0465F|nr:hypothetical protein [Bacillus badius]MED4715318.1 hypothetical protein [Bacillus badius]